MGFFENNKNTSGVLSFDDSCNEKLYKTSSSSPFGRPMKKLKKFKKKISIFSRSRLDNSVCTNNLPPLLFHSVHGENIRLLNSRRIARREESFCKGIVFTNRPVKINEKVTVRLSEVADTWTGFIRFGFTTHDPVTLENRLPKYACPDLTRQSGFWAKAVSDSYFQPDMILEFCVNGVGEVRYSINDQDLGVFLCNINVRSPLWALLDVYGNSTMVELIDPRHSLISNNSNTPDLERTESNSSSSSRSNASTPNRYDEYIPNMRSLSIGHDETRTRTVVHPTQQPRHLPTEQPPAAVDRISARHSNRQNVNEPENMFSYKPVPFNTRLHGSNIRFSNDKFIAYRQEDEFCNSCVFLEQPFGVNDCLAVQILETEDTYLGGLGFGLTSCNLSNLTSADLPEDINDLVDRPEYWVLKKHISNSSVVPEELLFWFNSEGSLMMRKNNGPPTFIFHVDTTQVLWPFFDVYGSTIQIRAFMCKNYGRNVSASTRRRIAYLDSYRGGEVTPMAFLPHIEVEQQSCGGATLMVNIPSYVTYIPATSQQQRSAERHRGTTIQYEQLPYDPNYSENSNQPTSGPGSTILRVSVQRNARAGSSTATVGTSNEARLSPIGPVASATNASAITLNSDQNQSSGASRENDCFICYEKPIDTVLYNCGHLCLCIECAFKLWRGGGDGHCPICRAVIRDVIRIYRP